MLHDDGGLTASPPVSYTLKVPRRGSSPLLFSCPLLTDKLFAKRLFIATSAVFQTAQRTMQLITETNSMAVTREFTQRRQ
jgi:hypothetical protein